MTFFSFRSKLGGYYTDAYMTILIVEAFFSAQLQISGEESYYVLNNKKINSVCLKVVWFGRHYSSQLLSIIRESITCLNH